MSYDTTEKKGTAGMSSSGWDHLNRRDTRTAEERREAEAKERRRRRGGDRDWWKRPVRG